MKTTYLLVSTVILFTLLAGCETNPTKSNKQTQAPSAQLTADHIQHLLEAAKTSESPLRELQLLQATDLLLKEEQADLAEQVIHSLNPSRLPPELYALHAQVRCKLSIKRGLYTEALNSLEDTRLLSSIDDLQPRAQLNLSILRAEVFALLGSHLASAQQRIFIGALLDPAEQISNQEAIWQSFMYVSIADLKNFQRKELGSEYQGWLELALIGKDNQEDLDKQVAQLENWQQRWASHPAATHLPGGLELIKELANNRAEHVALLLPLTGKLAPFAKAVRDGFIASMYRTRKNGGKIPLLKIYDTEKSKDFLTLYNQAIADGAQMVIGPLEKNHVRLLFDEMTLPVPTLALNIVDDYGQAPVNLYQFSLSPQDEAEQVASIAYLSNHRKALVVKPIGEWGNKVVNSFNQEWHKLGGQVIASSTYSGQADYSSSLKDSLLLASSHKRSARIERLIGEHIEFSPRRRSDIDMVFLLARPEQARSIKPLFAYHFAGELPVYSISNVYSGTRSHKDKDISNVYFTDMPWVLDKPSKLHQQVKRELPRSNQYQRMYALGIDSFQLYPRLRQLEAIQSSRVYGETGTLRLNAQKEIQRETLFAQIKNGVATIVPTAQLTLKQSLTTKEGADYDKNTKAKKSNNRRKN